MSARGPDPRPVCAGSGQMLAPWLDELIRGQITCPECGKTVRFSQVDGAVVKHRVGYATADSARRAQQRQEGER